MTFDDAMAAHLVWKLRLARLIDSANGEGLESTVVAKDTVCDFGQWIHGDGSKYMTMASYEQVVRKHADFHACAAEVVRKVHDGDKAGARRDLEGAFQSASMQLINAVAELRTEVGKSQLS